MALFPTHTVTVEVVEVDDDEVADADEVVVATSDVDASVDEAVVATGGVDVDAAEVVEEPEIED